VERLVDVRTAPGSRRMPHFARASLELTLPERGVEYAHMPELGGLRKPRPDSVNAGWRNDSFRGYADYMQTGDFQRGIDRLRALAAANTTAIMCAEAVPWRCHRNLVADELTRRGQEVIHILGPGATQKHVMNPVARAEGDHLVYKA